ncbi:MAG: SRPBCC family protein [Lacibacter sp.]|nr:SRPBCC family protein [Lacibacter sp.]
MSAENNTADRSIRLTRLLNAPIEQLWEVWTNPEHIKHWWGPNGFTNTITKMDLQPGGEWLLVMHGPDGTDYENKSVFTEVIKHQKIVYEHISGHYFIASIEFEAQDDATVMHWEMLFETKEEYHQFVIEYKVGESLQQNIERLVQYLERSI